MIKIVKPKDFNDFKNHVIYGRLAVVKHNNMYALCMAFKKSQKGWTLLTEIDLYELELFDSIDQISGYIRTGKIEEIYDRNFTTLNFLGYDSFDGLWYVKNFKLNNEKLKSAEVKSRLMGWVPYDKMWK